MRLSRRALTSIAVATPLLFPASGVGQNATPTAEFGHANNRKNELLQFVPGGVLDDPLDLIWIDLERIVASMAHTHDGAVDDNVRLSLLSSMASAKDPDLVFYLNQTDEFAGFDGARVQQMLQYGEPARICQLVQLELEVEDLIPFWESQDYEQRENDYGTFWTIDEDGEFSFEHPVQQRMLNKLNNVAILDQHTVAYAPTAELVGQIMATAAGESPHKIAELEPISTGIAEDTTSLWYLDGDNLALETVIGDQSMSAERVAQIENMLAESEAAVGAMPAIRTICTGVTAGAARFEDRHDPESREFIILEMDEAGMAGQAADVIAWRLENMVSLNAGSTYSSLLPNMEIDVLNDELVRASFLLENPRTMFSNLIVSRDILLFGYESQE